MTNYKEMLEFIVKTNNPTIFYTWQSKAKNLYKFDEHEGWILDFDDEKIIDLLFEIVKNLDKQNETLKEQLIEHYNLCVCRNRLIKGE